MTKYVFREMDSNGIIDMFCVVAIGAATCCCKRGTGGQVNEGLSVIHKLK